MKCVTIFVEIVPLVLARCAIAQVKWRLLAKTDRCNNISKYVKLCIILWIHNILYSNRIKHVAQLQNLSCTSLVKEPVSLSYRNLLDRHLITNHKQCEYSWMQLLGYKLQCPFHLKCCFTDPLSLLWSWKWFYKRYKLIVQKCLCDVCVDCCVCEWVRVYVIKIRYIFPFQSAKIDSKPIRVARHGTTNTAINLVSIYVLQNR